MNSFFGKEAFARAKATVDPMAKILNSPGRYIQGSGELENLGKYTKNYGSRPLAIVAKPVEAQVMPAVRPAFEENKMTLLAETFGGECCQSEIDRLSALVAEHRCDCVIGIGGGKALDTAKAVAHAAAVPVLICPTIASTDAPCSALSVIYTEQGAFSSYLFLPSNPDLVLVDTSVIVHSPVRLTVSGMGDALATYFEARACRDAAATTCAGGKVTLAAMALATQCLETLMDEGVKAKLALQEGICTAAVKKIIEANTLLSGIGFESGGLAAAHAIHNGLTVLPECHSMYHGEKVAFGTIVQLMLENAPEEELHEILSWCCELGLPITLAQLGITSPTEEALMRVADAACADDDTMHNMPFPITPDDVFAAIRAADSYGRYFLGA